MCTDMEEELKKYTPSQFREVWSTFKSEPLKVLIHKENKRERKRRNFSKATLGELVRSK